jgi:hypothetical protein
MAGTIEELPGVKPSGSGVPAYSTMRVDMDGGSGFSEPILLGGRKVVSIQANGVLAATNLIVQGALFSSRTTTDEASYRDGVLIPLDADFNDWYDKANALIQIMGTTGQQGWSIGEAGFPLWIRISLSVPQAVSIHIVAKG